MEFMTIVVTEQQCWWQALGFRKTRGLGDFCAFGPFGVSPSETWNETSLGFAIKSSHGPAVIIQNILCSHGEAVVLESGFCWNRRSIVTLHAGCMRLLYTVGS